MAFLQDMRSGGRVVEGARLESEYTAKPYRGFESLPLRHFLVHNCPYRHVLRNPLVHGGATWNGDVNRAQVDDGQALLRCRLPILFGLTTADPDQELRAEAVPMPKLSEATRVELAAILLASAIPFLAATLEQSRSVSRA